MNPREYQLLIPFAVKRLVRIASGVEISLEEAKTNGNVRFERSWDGFVVRINYWVPKIANVTVVLDGEKARERLADIGREERIEIAAADGVGSASTRGGCDA